MASYPLRACRYWEKLLQKDGGGWPRHLPEINDAGFQNTCKSFLAVCETNFWPRMGNIMPQSVVHGDHHHWNYVRNIISVVTRSGHRHCMYVRADE